MQLPEAAIDQNQIRKFPLLFLQARVAARDHFAHGCEVVVAFDGPDDELAVIGLLHSAVFPDHHAGHFVGALNVRNIKTLDALGASGRFKASCNASEITFDEGFSTRNR